MPIHILRQVMRFLFHNYPPEEKRGYSKCQNTLQTMFLALKGGTHNGVTNHNLTFESFNQDKINKSSIEGILKRVEEKARGKRHFIQAFLDLRC